MRALDRRTMDEAGVAEDELMRRAARGLTDCLLDLLEARAVSRPHVLLIAGKGNNGGDAEVAHGMLKEEGIRSALWRVDEVDWTTASAGGFHIIVDGLLGTGTAGAPRGNFAEAVQFINRSPALKVAIDIPTGLNADTGEPQGETVRAGLTVTMGLPKTGLIRPESVEFTGSIEVIDIGIPAAYIAATAGCPEAELISRSDVLLPSRSRDSHKGTYGHVLLIGGAPGYTGAIAMAARAALRSGAGLVSVRVPQAVCGMVAAAAGPEAMVKPFSRLGEIDLTGFDAVLAGPGLTRTAETRAFVEQLLAICHVPLVLDADALSIPPASVAKAKCPVVLTPHPGEFAAWFGMTVEQIQADRWSAARQAAERTGHITILKGARTVVAAPGKKLAVNSTGNPGMAKGGSGDVLAGLLTGLLGRGIEPFQAAKTAVWLHGKAGDLAAGRVTEEAMAATDLIDAFRALLA